MAQPEAEYPAMPWPETRVISKNVGPPVAFTLNSRRYPAPASQDPLTIFKPMINMCTVPGPRWVEMDKTGGSKHAILIFTDGAAPNNGLQNVRAGCGISIRPDGRGEFSFPLERVSNEPLTSNRAELRAAYAALCLRYWNGEGFEKIVIATDSEYLVFGVNEWVLRWKKNGWKNSEGKNVKNKDLWQILLKKIEDEESMGMVVQFYLIQRRFNLADAAAKKGADVADVPTVMTEIMGVMI
ncbi:ribonuclease H-like domain-containing protein [Flammula alnicola]|nr:ribonuclease H-like domain-containing protein [Flammula alnicola]